MEVLILTVFASALLAVLALLFFAWNVRQRNHDHTDRLALLPLQEDDGVLTPEEHRKGKP